MDPDSLLPVLQEAFEGEVPEIAPPPLKRIEYQLTLRQACILGIIYGAQGKQLSATQIAARLKPGVIGGPRATAHSVVRQILKLVEFGLVRREGSNQRVIRYSSLGAALPIFSIVSRGRPAIGYTEDINLSI